ncbi:hypothetical protein FRC00_012131 [Tulasnella sp. 408]|nr:hypothetical protein FRC00_012131 [Tulasnella sp. 408]
MSALELAIWVPSVLPYVEDITFDVSQWDQAEVVISAPKLAHCVSNSERNLVFRECNIMHEYSTAGIIFNGSRILPWGQLVFDLHTHCPAIKILEIGDNKWHWTRSFEETSSPWPPLLQLQILRFTRVVHDIVHTFLSRFNAPNLKVVEIVGTHNSNQMAAIVDIDSGLPTIEIPPGVDWRLRFKDNTLPDIHDALQHIKIQPQPAIEIDLMGLIPRRTLTAQLDNSDRSQAGEHPLSTSEDLKRYLETDWVATLDRLPSVIWVIKTGQDDWIPVNLAHSPSLHEVVEYIHSATTREVE